MTLIQQELIDQLTAIREAVGKTTLLSSILDETWFELLENEIANSSTIGVLAADRSGFLYSLHHPLRAAAWFEADQKLFLEGRVDEIDADGRLALAMCGIDPVRTFIPLIESRLKAFAEISFKQEVVQAKLKQLRCTRSEAAFKNYLFEINVLGDLALKGVLRDIEESTTNVDGVIDLAGRQIFIEATNTVQEFLPGFIGVGYLDSKVEIDQVVKKLHMKVSQGRQLALAKAKPTLLFLALTHHGAGRNLAQIAIDECFCTEEFAALSGIVLADSWKFQITSWHPGVTPDTPLTEAEARRLYDWYAKR